MSRWATRRPGMAHTLGADEDATGWLTVPMARERRLVFGEVADLYERYRPQYPEALVDEVLRRAAVDPGRAVLEVGSGTGKATRQFARRGVAVLAVEPSAEMAAVARRHLAEWQNVAIEQGD